jgi:integrase
MDRLINGMYKLVRDDDGKYVVDPRFTGCECDRGCTCRFKRELAVRGIGNLKLSKMTGGLMQGFYNRLRASGASAATVHRYHSTFQRAFNLAIRWRYMTHNPAKETERPDVIKPVIHRPANATVLALIEAAFDESLQYGCGVLLHAEGSPRRGEVCAARWNKLNGNVWTIDEAVRHPKGKGVTAGHPTKTHAEREVPLDAFTMAALADLRVWSEQRAADAGTALAPNAFIFSDAADGSAPWQPNRLSDVVGRLRDRVGYQGRLQDLRGWGLAEAYNGDNLPEIVSRGGWGNASTFLTYYLRSSGVPDDKIANTIGDKLALARATARRGDELAARRRRKAAAH